MRFHVQLQHTLVTLNLSNLLFQVNVGTDLEFLIDSEWEVWRT